MTDFDSWEFTHTSAGGAMRHYRRVNLPSYQPDPMVLRLNPSPSWARQLTDAEFAVADAAYCAGSTIDMTREGVLMVDGWEVVP